ncbi:MAG: type IV toxin-antitoxin system AbiEi family antitoxin domain-containing protein [Lachnospiraceae bacterium]|nr:type IV toxin-antitoxin system AbiEi family antitoxin domain-containing protein [Lachnospiraceae bacterium]
MRQQTYDNVARLDEKYHGYIKTTDLLSEGLTNRQIAQLQLEGYLDKISNGYFWLSKSRLEKPWDYKAVEVGFVNENAVVIAGSACYYQGLIKEEPPILSIATRRSDRHKMKFPFSVSRHYFAEDMFESDMKSVQTEFGSYRIYSIDRSVCDCIRFREDLEDHIFDLVIENYQKKYADERRRERMLTYARMMKFEEKARRVL